MSTVNGLPPVSDLVGRTNPVVLASSIGQTQPYSITFEVSDAFLEAAKRSEWSELVQFRFEERDGRFDLVLRTVETVTAREAAASRHNHTVKSDIRSGVLFHGDLVRVAAHMSAADAAIEQVAYVLFTATSRTDASWESIPDYEREAVRARVRAALLAYSAGDADG